MNTILRRKDNTSICCPSINQRPARYPAGKIKIIGFAIACTLIVVGLFIILLTV